MEKIWETAVAVFTLSRAGDAAGIPAKGASVPIRPCIDCGTPTDQGSHCTQHRRARENARPRASAHARGYDAEHQRQRAALALTLPAPCGYGCGRLLDPEGDWVAAHVVDGDPTAGYLASCRSCNELAKRR